jgi:hypothetical protein
MKIIPIAVLSCLFVTEGSGAVILYSFTGSSGNEPVFPVDSSPEGGGLSDFSRGTGIQPSSKSGAFSAKSWTTQSSLDTSDYFSFTLSPDAGQSFSLTRLELDERRSGTGIREWSVRSSLDLFSTDLGVFSVPDNSDVRRSQTLSLGDAFSRLTQPVEFRVFAYSAESSVGTWWVDNVQGTVTFSAVPEPEEYATVSALILLGLAIHRRQKNRELVSNQPSTSSKARPVICIGGLS